MAKLTRITRSGTIAVRASTSRLWCAPRPCRQHGTHSPAGLRGIFARSFQATLLEKVHMLVSKTE